MADVKQREVRMSARKRRGKRPRSQRRVHHIVVEKLSADDVLALIALLRSRGVKSVEETQDG